MYVNQNTRPEGITLARRKRRFEGDVQLDLEESVCGSMVAGFCEHVS
jgi:hypothetical protein